ncbi:hypothetical protein [Streptomyces sp. WAC06614]|uniref:hypothetical protein n=1 Tax=Streptomyces sp. WAC06614 TaxID=2487416 RepID=UPI00163CEF19|nr:hypothetical protein [Streptomyces sp. WAC06614]
MGTGGRFHLDQDGHSITVRLVRAPGPVEVLVDGKVVAQGPAPHRGTTVLRAELPGEPLRPVILTLAEVRGAYRCEMELGGVRYTLPHLPLTERSPAAPTAPHPLRRLRRSLRRIARRAVSGSGRHR